MLDIIISVAASMGAGQVAGGIAKALGAPPVVVNAVRGIVSNMVGAEMNAHHDTPTYHGDPSPSLLHDSGPFAEFRRHRAG